MPTDTIKWIKINWKVLDTINDNRSIIGSTEADNRRFSSEPDMVESNSDADS